jgi:hypothetical protein
MFMICPSTCDDFAETAATMLQERRIGGQL